MDLAEIASISSTVFLTASSSGSANMHMKFCVLKCLTLHVAMWNVIHYLILKPVSTTRSSFSSSQLAVILITQSNASIYDLEQ